MKQTQVIFLSFASGVSTTTAYLNVPFTVKTIHVKSLNYLCATNQTKYAVLQSNIGLNAPFGILNLDNSYSSASIQDIEIQLKNPQVLQGSYDFNLKYMDNTAFNVGAVSYICMIIEFNGPDEIM